MWGLPAMLIVFAATGLLRGMQDTVTPLWIAGLGFGANALLNWLFIYGFGWGIGGSAFGTVVAQWGMVAAYVVVIGRLARRHAASVRPQREGVRGSARSGGWLFLRTLSLRAALLATVFVATGLGTEELAGWQVAFTIFSTAAFALDALAIAAQALIGKGLGAGDTGEVQRTLGAHRGMGRLVRRRSSGAVIGALSGVIGLLFTGDAALAALIQPALIVLAVAQPVCGVVFVLDGVLIGAGDAKYLAIAGVLNLVPFVPALVAARRAERGRRGRTRVARGRVLRGLHAGAARDPRLARPRRGLDDGRSVRGQAQRRHHSYITTAAAADALIERVEPYWVISTAPDAAASASGERPGPSWPNSSTHRSRQVGAVDGHGARQVVDRDDREGCGIRPFGEGRDILVVPHVLVAVGDHRAAPVPAAPADDVHLGGEERVRAAHDRADVHVVLPVLDRDMERMPLPVEVGDDRVHAPVAVLVDDVAGVAVREQFRIEARVVGPGLRPARPRPDAVRRARARALRLGAGLGGHRLRLLGVVREAMCTRSTQPGNRSSARHIPSVAARARRNTTRIFRSTEKCARVSVCRKLPRTSTSVRRDRGRPARARPPPGSRG